METIDPELKRNLAAEEARQREQLQLIPSENYVSSAVRKLVGSVLMNKYPEGQPLKRYYQGNQFIDRIELRAKENALNLFYLDPDEWDVNVQAATGSIANFATLSAVCNPNETILSMYLYDGGHLSHGWQLPSGKKVSFSSRIYDIQYYRVDPNTEQIDYDKLRQIAQQVQPKVIITGGTAYPSQINYAQVSEISKQVGAVYLADVAHEAGLIAAGVNQSPFPFADIVTMTTRKTLRGPVGALIFSNSTRIPGIAEKINTAVFPGLQGGPLNHSIAGIAQCLFEANSDSFRGYSQQVILNAKRMASNLSNGGLRVVTGGTEKHFVLIDLSPQALQGKNLALALDQANIIVNANTHPREQGSPFNPTGIRVGTPAVTSRGMHESEMDKICGWIIRIFDKVKTAPQESAAFQQFLTSEQAFINQIAEEVRSFACKYPVPGLD